MASFLAPPHGRQPVRRMALRGRDRRDGGGSCGNCWWVFRLFSLSLSLSLSLSRSAHFACTLSHEGFSFYSRTHTHARTHTRTTLTHPWFQLKQTRTRALPSTLAARGPTIASASEAQSPPHPSATISTSSAPSGRLTASPPWWTESRSGRSQRTIGCRDARAAPPRLLPSTTSST